MEDTPGHTKDGLDGVVPMIVSVDISYCTLREIFFPTWCAFQLEIKSVELDSELELGARSRTFQIIKKCYKENYHFGH